jgi:epoxyqueuosine reductase
MKDLIKSKAMESGFSAVGVTSADPVGESAHLEGAIGGGRVAEMGWLARNPKARCDPRSLLPGARSVICCALAYGDGGLPSPESRVPSSGTMARFARGADYHVVVREKLEQLWKVIQVKAPDARCKICVDTSPILEKALAARAGLGWIGKHTVLLNRELGSWFVLGEIMTDIEIEPDPPASNMCGECRKCIDACPTKAITSPQELDARKCISYLTIEAPRLAPPSPGSRVPSSGSYGCDLCQEACPYNR